MLIDLSCAFDLVNHSRFCKCMDKLGMPKEIILLLTYMYSNLTAKVHFGTKGEVTPSFGTGKGDRQGCVLAPFFSLYINGVEETLQVVGADPPRIGRQQIPILLYVDDEAVLALTPNSLQSLLTQILWKGEGLKLA